MIYINNNGDTPCTRHAKSKSPIKMYNDQMANKGMANKGMTQGLS